MAWSDAARRAAAEARRLHKQTKGNFGRVLPQMKLENRKFLAQVLKSHRRRGLGYGVTVPKIEGYYAQAVMSTNLRNSFRRKR